MTFYAIHASRHMQHMTNTIYEQEIKLKENEVDGQHLKTEYDITEDIWYCFKMHFFFGIAGILYFILHLRRTCHSNCNLIISTYTYNLISLSKYHSLKIVVSKYHFLRLFPITHSCGTTHPQVRTTIYERHVNNPDKKAHAIHQDKCYWVKHLSRYLRQYTL